MSRQFIIQIIYCMVFYHANIFLALSGKHFTHNKVSFSKQLNDTECKKYTLFIR